MTHTRQAWAARTVDASFIRPGPAQFAAIPAAELIAAAKDILGRPGVTQAVADLAPIYEALPNGEAKVHIGNFRQVALAVPTILGQQLASAAQGA